MFEHKKLSGLEQYFNKLNGREEKTVYFYRINAYSQQVEDFLMQYYEEARQNGVVIIGKIPNPDEGNLSYYEEMMGLDFQLSPGFINASLKKWLPRMNSTQRENVTYAVYDVLLDMAKEGKNQNMQKNTYIKFMCWLYYKFERIVNRLGAEDVPKILYEGEVSQYEWKLLCVLSKAGCDIVLLQKNGDSKYLTLDPKGTASLEYSVPGGQPFPPDFSVDKLAERNIQQQKIQQLYGKLPAVNPCTNAWIKGKGLEDILKATYARGEDKRFFYNCLYRFWGVWDKLTYINDLRHFYQELKGNKRQVVIVNKRIEPPSMEEIALIKRGNYQSAQQMLMDLKNNIHFTANQELHNLMVKAFLDVMLKEAEQPQVHVNKLMNKAVYLLCWLKRFQSGLFSNWNMPDIACFIYLGGCKNENEILFCKMLSALPVDVAIFVPNKNEKCLLEDKSLYELTYEESLVVEEYPSGQGQVQIGTAAYHAERELDTMLYQDTGMYRNQQYQKAESLRLQTMYEEIAILWDQEVRFRPNFATTDQQVNIPVLFAKVSGVKDGKVSEYWSKIKALLTEDTILVSKGAYVDVSKPNPMKAYATEFFKGGKLLKKKIKEHKAYSYQVLRDEMQEHLLDKLALLIEQRWIRGTFENGMEYTIIATVLNMEKDMVRRLQRFDFTKKNPKLIFINPSEEILSLEDSIMAAYFSLVGLDVVFFVPTGYRSVEKYFNGKVMEEHQIGEYVYDLQVPDFASIPSNIRPTWRERIFKR